MSEFAATSPSPVPTTAGVRALAAGLKTVVATLSASTATYTIHTRSAESAKRIIVTAAALARSASHIARERFQRSSSTPAHGPTINAGNASRATARPVAAADPVSWNTCTGIATTSSQDPMPEIPPLIQSRRKSGFRKILTIAGGISTEHFLAKVFCGDSLLGVDLSAELRDRRKAANRTIASVAVDAGLSVPYIANLENGRGNPTLAALDRLATALGTRLQVTLVDEQPPTTSSSTASELLATSARAPRVVAELAAARGDTKRVVERDLLATLDALGKLLPGVEPSTADLDRLLDLLLLAAKT
ncbi:helix-turn-helix transcriptional regulator [Kribbella sp. NPDC056861]|uniref:helix-turn-helix domain-containing protein n=1 Tax=Kribbella sp. NPDC056861 TaxID=3154857 RepID=UPI00341D1F8A